MSAQYTPRRGSLADRTINLLRESPAGTAFSAEQLRDQLGVQLYAVSTSLKPAVAAGVLAVVKHGHSFHWSLAPEPEEPDGTLEMCRYSDGDLCVKGMQINDGETAQFTQAQLQQLVDFATQPHVVPRTTPITTGEQP